MLQQVWKMWQYDWKTKLSYPAKFQKDFKNKIILAGGELDEKHLKFQNWLYKKI